LTLFGIFSTIKQVMEAASNGFYSRTRLESLSTGELIKLAEDVDIDIPPGLERIFIIEELLLENLHSKKHEKEDNESELTILPSHMDPVAIPQQYNISFIEVIVRDPLWVFVHWEIKEQDRRAHENAGDFNGYYLRVYQLKEGETTPSTKENSFILQIDENDSGRYLSFTERLPADSGCYIVKLCVNRGDAEIYLAISQPFRMPRLVNNTGNGEFDQNPLIRLSGMADLATIKTINRQARIKGAK